MAFVHSNSSNNTNSNNNHSGNRSNNNNHNGANQNHRPRQSSITSLFRSSSSLTHHNSPSTTTTHSHSDLPTSNGIASAGTIPQQQQQQQHNGNGNFQLHPHPHPGIQHSRTSSFSKKIPFNLKNPFKSNSTHNVISTGDSSTSTSSPHYHQVHGHPQPALDPSSHTHTHTHGHGHASKKPQVPVLKIDTTDPHDKSIDPKQKQLQKDSKRKLTHNERNEIHNESHENDDDDDDDEDQEDHVDVTELTEEDDIISSSSDTESCSSSSTGSSTSTTTSSSQAFEEDEKDYCHGGYHPIFVGEMYGPKQNYKIVRKLGWGHFSTVWLAYDILTDTHVAMKIVRSAKHYTEAAVDEVKILSKINKGNNDHPGKNHIVKLLDSFLIQGPNGLHMCMCFEVLGENMLNLTKKFKNYQKLNQIDEIYGGLPLPLVKHITRQLLLALDYLHTECGLIHTDIKPENVLIEIKDVETLLRIVNKNQDGTSSSSKRSSANKQKNNPTAVAVSDNKLAPQPTMAMATTGPSMLLKKNNSTSTKNRPPMHRSRKSVSKIGESPIRSSKPLPSPLSTEEIFHRSSSVVSTPILEETINQLQLADEPIIEEEEGQGQGQGQSLGQSPGQGQGYRPDELISVKIADLGNACWTNLHYTDDIQTRQYRSPEIVLGGDWGCSADIWSLGCLIFELITSDYLFDPKNGPTYDKNDDHLAQVIELLDQWPDRDFLDQCQYTNKYILRGTSSMRLKRIKNLKIWTLTNVLMEKYRLNNSDANEISEFIQCFLKFEPANRMDSGSLLNHKWLKDPKITTDNLLPGRKFGTKGEYIKGWSCLVEED